MLNFCYMFNHHPYTQALNYFFHNYYFFLGLDQDFGVFAPVPRNSNPHLVAIVRYKDGTTRIWNSPRMERLGFLEKIPKERYRKFFDDNCVWDKVPETWPDIARGNVQTAPVATGLPEVKAFLHDEVTRLEVTK